MVSSFTGILSRRHQAEQILQFFSENFTNLKKKKKKGTPQLLPEQPTLEIQPLNPSLGFYGWSVLRSAENEKT